jgi:anthranilate phosphoribosyltransferase
MIEELLRFLPLGDLTASQMEQSMEEIMTGAVPAPLVASFLVALRDKGETAGELAAAVSVMRRHAVHVDTGMQDLIDTCGTGGDMKNSFNVSTASAFVVSAMGVAVAKHGNRASSGRTGSADVLEALGVSLSLGAAEARECLRKTGIAFMFAPNFHPAIRFAMPARKAVQGKTLFNFLGPLSNPAGAQYQLIGVADERWAQLMAQALTQLGTRHALVVRGRDGLDEISTTQETDVFDVRAGSVTRGVLSYREFGIRQASLEDLEGKDAAHNAALLRAVLEGKKGPQRDIVVLNAAAAFYAADRAGNLLHEAVREGIKRAEEAIDSGRALEKLEQLIKFQLS